MADDESIEELRARLDGLHGPIRTPTLLRLAERLYQKYWAAGPGQPAAKAYLDEAIATAGEAHGRLEPGDTQRVIMAAQVGIMYAARYGTHGGARSDLDTGIELLDEAVGNPVLPPALRSMSLFSLGQLYLQRIVQGAQADAMAALRAGASPAGGADVDRAIACFREILDGDHVNAEMRTMAEFGLELTTVLQAMSGGLGSVDLGRMIQAMETMRSLQDRIRNGGIRLVPTGPDAQRVVTIFDADELVKLSPQDRPAPVAPGPIPPARDIPRPSRPVEPTVDQAAAARRELYPAVCRLAGTDHIATAATALLDAESGPTLWEIDDLVGLAGTAVYEGGDANPADHGLDHLLLAVALELRARAQGQDPDDPDGDHRAGAASLADALDAIPPDHTGAAEALRCLGAFLSEQNPLGAPLDGLADRLVDRAAAIVDAGSADPVTAILRDICRAAAGRGYAVGAVPDDYRWSAPLRAAAAAAESLHELYGNTTAREVVAALRALGVDALLWPRRDDDCLMVDSRGRLMTAGTETGKRLMILPGAFAMPPAEDAIMSFVTSPGQVVDLARRDARPVAEHPVFVANPRGDREVATVDAVVLRRMFYPRSVGLGRTVEQVDGAGTPDEVLAHLNASMLHLGCEAGPAGLALAGPGTLAAETIRGYAGARGSGVAILPAAAAEASPVLADALIDAGFASVIGWLHEVPAAAESLMLFLLHARLVDDGLDAPAAVHSVREWLADPRRVAPAYLPAAYAAVLPEIGDHLLASGPRSWGR